MEEKARIEKWSCLELSFKGRKDGNPFKDYNIQGRFIGEHEDKTVEGFYDGDDIYRVRFMPSYSGEYSYTISGSFGESRFGGFIVDPPSSNNHGPVCVQDKYYFSYSDGKPFYPVGITCYVWELQSDELIKQTLESLRISRFNKIRFCILPKHYDYNLGEPRSYPFVGTPMDSSMINRENFHQYTGKSEGNNFDFTRLNPVHFQHIEKCIEKLQELGIEADLIVMHPYDRWGFSSMNRETDELYWRYVLARFSAYRNVWWSASLGGCYLSTACCKYKGLDDSCNELVTLREFRDSYIRNQSYGDRLIHSYYESDPAIVQAIEQHGRLIIKCL